MEYNNTHCHTVITYPKEKKYQWSHRGIRAIYIFGQIYLYFPYSKYFIVIPPPSFPFLRPTFGMPAAIS